MMCFSSFAIFKPSSSRLNQETNGVFSHRWSYFGFSGLAQLLCGLLMWSVKIRLIWSFYTA